MIFGEVKSDKQWKEGVMDTYIFNIAIQLSK